jgi:transcription elongation factor Elf1
MNLKCLFFGHNKVSMLIENNDYIYTSGCSRCKQPTSLPSVWKHTPPPPNSTSEQLDEWFKFVEDKYEHVRNSVK